VNYQFSHYSKGRGVFIDGQPLADAPEPASVVYQLAAKSAPEQFRPLDEPAAALNTDSWIVGLQAENGVP